MAVFRELRMKHPSTQISLPIPRTDTVERKHAKIPAPVQSFCELEGCEFEYAYM